MKTYSARDDCLMITDTRHDSNFHQSFCFIDQQFQWIFVVITQINQFL